MGNEPKIQYFNGVRFIRDDKTRYYLSSNAVCGGNKERMHRYVWRFYHGEIPDGYHIHHIDNNRANNSIENLELIDGTEHIQLHGKNISEERRNEMRSIFITKAMPKAIEWHRTKEASEIAKKNWDSTLGPVIRTMAEYTCIVCGKKYETSIIFNGRSKFCSNKCKSKWRRDQKIDYEKRRCLVCGSEFNTNKYSHIMTCSMKCRTEILVENRNRGGNITWENSKHLVLLR